MLLAVQTTTWVIYAIVTFLIISHLVFNRIVGVDFITSKLESLLGVVRKADENNKSDNNK